MTFMTSLEYSAKYIAVVFKETESWNSREIVLKGGESEGSRIIRPAVICLKET